MPLPGSYTSSSRPKIEDGGTILEKLRSCRMRLEECNRQKDGMFERLRETRTKFGKILYEKDRMGREMEELKKTLGVQRIPTVI